MFVPLLPPMPGSSGTSRVLPRVTVMLLGIDAELGGEHALDHRVLADARFDCAGLHGENRRRAAR